MDQGAQGRDDQFQLAREFKYDKVTIFKDFKFGSGAYGTVYKARCDDKDCAAKVLHDLLCDVNTSKQFCQEIQLVLKLSHEGSNNIVRCLGVHTDLTVSQVPILLMELMDCNLAHYLADESVETISLRTQLEVCRDIVQAVDFLHSHGIIHRDLSGNNVLLMLSDHGGDKTIRVAKVGDFGVAKACYDLIPNQQSMCPGTQEYMPPEALLTTTPNYTEKLDCFSIGVLMIQILTRLYPKPKGLISNPGDPEPRVVSEIKRRRDHIDTINTTYRLLPNTPPNECSFTPTLKTSSFHQ